VRAGERLTAEASVEHKRRRVHRLDDRRTFLVQELADVEVALGAVGGCDTLPAEHDVACGLHQPLAFDHALADVDEAGRVAYTWGQIMVQLKRYAETGGPDPVFA
jgi:hypothetical protein